MRRNGRFWRFLKAIPIRPINFDAGRHVVRETHYAFGSGDFGIRICLSCFGVVNNRVDINRPGKRGRGWASAHRRACRGKAAIPRLLPHLGNAVEEIYANHLAPSDSAPCLWCPVWPD